MVIPNRTARLCNIGYAAFMGALDVIAKREEGVGSQRYTAHLI